MTAKPLSEEELAAIRRRHYVDDGVRSEYDDAALLLAEVDRLRSEILEATATADRLQEERDRLRHLLNLVDNFIYLRGTSHSGDDIHAALNAYRAAAEEKHER